MESTDDADDDRTAQAYEAVYPELINVDRGAGIAHAVETFDCIPKAQAFAREQSKRYGVELILRGTAVYLLEPKGDKRRFKSFYSTHCVSQKEMSEKQAEADVYERNEYDWECIENDYNPLWKPPRY